MSLSMRNLGLGLMSAAGATFFGAYLSVALYVGPLWIPSILVVGSLALLVAGAGLYDLRTVHSHGDPAYVEVFEAS